MGILGVERTGSSQHMRLGVYGIGRDYTSSSLEPCKEPRGWCRDLGIRFSSSEEKNSPILTGPTHETDLCKMWKISTEMARIWQEQKEN